MTTYYVSSEIGSNNNAGTSATAPLATLQAAEDLVHPGDTVEVMNGTYTGPKGGDVVDITTSGTASAPITFEAAPGQTPVINSSGSWNAIKIEASYIVVNGFTVVGDAANYTLSQALAAYSTGSANLDGAGINVTGNPGVNVPNHITIENNTVYNEPGGGIGSGYADYLNILNNVVYDNAHWSAFGNSGISIFQSVNSDTNSGVHDVVSGNLVFGNAQLVPTTGAGTITDGEGIILDTNTAFGFVGEILVENNTVYGNGSAGIESFRTNGAVITENTVYGNNTANVLQTASVDEIFINQSNNDAVTNNITTAPDLTPPTISSLVESPASGDLNAGKTVTLTLNLSEAVTVAGGTPTLTLNDGGTATYTGGSGTNALTFSYTVGAGQNTSALTAAAIDLNSATVTDGAGNADSLSLAGLTQIGPQVDTTTPSIVALAESPVSGDLNAGKVVTVTLDVSEVVIVNTTGGTPTVTLNDGGVATYTGGSGANALTFSYTVLAGENTPDLMGTAVNLNGAIIVDGAGNSANLSLAGLPQGSPQIDTTAPTISSITESPASGDLSAGNTVTLTLNLSEAVTVADGTPTITLNDTGTATYTGGSGTNTLTFSYTVGAGQNTSALAAAAINLNSATITDGAGNAANLSLTGLTQNGPQIDTTAPAAPIIISDKVVGTLVVLSGTEAENGTVISIYDGTTLLERTTTGTSGTWVFETGPLANGAHVFTATATDLAGNVSAPSGPYDPNIGAGPAITAAPIQLGSQIYIYNGSGAGLALSYAGSNVTAGEFGSWTPIAATQTAGGYDIAWQNAGTNQYTVWTTDSNGDYAGNLLGAVSGNNYALESLESVFNQDLNGDGTVGLTTTVIQTDTNAFGSTSLTEVANLYFYLDGSGSGPALKYAGSNVMVGEFGGWTPIGAVQTAGGYDIAWQNAGTNQYTVWTTDSNGNYAGNLVGAVSGNSYALESLESVFNQDLNGDGTVGLTTTVIQTDTNAFGSTSLTEVANAYFYLDGSSGSGPALKYAGSNVMVGEFGGWTPIGAVQTAGGYDIAWQNAGTNQYTVWTTDSNGNYTGNLVGAVSGNSYALESLESVFNQDLNGDGTVGLTTTVIQTDTNAFGSTSLTEVANAYFYLDGSSGSGPALKYAGSNVMVGEFGGWTPIGAVQTAGGYDIAWQNADTNQYTVWTTDSNGNYTGNLIGAVSGNSYALESFESVFNQDLNGDGVTGLNPLVIKTDTSSFGSISLGQIGNNYFLFAAGGTTGPELQYNSAAVTSGMFGSFNPIGAVQTATGYDVAWQNISTGQYTVWTTDSNGDYTGNLIGAVSGNSYALESFESVFNQDLNGDGVTGLYVPPGATLNVAQSLAATSVAATIASDGTLELTVADSAGVTFVASTGQLKLDQPSSFTGKIFNFAGDGTLSGSDQIDLKGINYNTIQESYADGVLTVADGSGNSAKLNFSGPYTRANFSFASDGAGGTIVYDPPVSPSSGQDTIPPKANVIGTGATLDLAASDSESVTFASSTGKLVLDSSVSAQQAFDFTGTVSGFGRQNVIDLPEIAFNGQTTLGYSPNSNLTGGTLSIANGAHSANVALLGNYMASSFVMASDSHGGTMLLAEAAMPNTQSLLGNPHHA